MAKIIKDLVRLDHRIVYGSSFYISATTTKVLYSLMAKYIDKELLSLNAHKGFFEFFVPTLDLSASIMEVESNGEIIVKSKNALYDTKRVNKVVNELLNLTFRFTSNILVNNESLAGGINLCSRIIPTELNGTKGHIFRVDTEMTQLLFDLERYVLVYRREVNRLRSAYSIRLFQMLRGEANRLRRYGFKTFNFRLSLDLVRELFRLNEKEAYKEFKHLNNLILKKAWKEITEHTSLEVVNVRKLKINSRTTNYLEIEYKEKQFEKGFALREGDLTQLTAMEKKAYYKLVDFGIDGGIVLRQILPNILGSEVRGYEDYFIDFSYQYYEKHATNAKNKDNKKLLIGTYVNWWTKKKIFNPSTPKSAWSVINEQVVVAKKKLREKNPTEFSERGIQKDMTAKEFKKWRADNRHGRS